MKTESKKDEVTNLLRDVRTLNALLAVLAAICVAPPFMVLFATEQQLLQLHRHLLIWPHLLFLAVIQAAAWMSVYKLRKGLIRISVFKDYSVDQFSCFLRGRKALVVDIHDSQPYIDVMHDQIGDSLAESESEVMKVIEQINYLNERSNRQRERIAQSIQSGKALTEATHLRAESNKQIVAALEMQMEQQTRELRGVFEHVQSMATEVRALTPLIKRGDRGGAGGHRRTRLCGGGLRGEKALRLLHQGRG